MKKLILIFAFLILTGLFLAGCATTLSNSIVKFTKYGPGGKNILNVWELSVPSKSNVEFDPKNDKVIYTGKTAGVFENIKDLLMLKAIQTDVTLSNKEGK